MYPLLMIDLYHPTKIPVNFQKLFYCAIGELIYKYKVSHDRTNHWGKHGIN